MNAYARQSGLLACALAAFWIGRTYLNPAAQRLVGMESIEDPALQTLVGHWLTWQLPGVLLVVAVWLVAQRLGLMPSLRRSLGLGLGWRPTVRWGLICAVLLIATTFGFGATMGSFGWHPPWVKMVGDLGSNMYEEIVYRGLLFCAFYGAFAGKPFVLKGDLSRIGTAAGIVGSGVVFAASHTQYPVPLQVVLGLLSVLFAWPWIKARSLWAPWIVHQLGDMVGDSLVTL